MACCIKFIQHSSGIIVSYGCHSARHLSFTQVFGLSIANRDDVGVAFLFDVICH